jgi:hypothetical protein
MPADENTGENIVQIKRGRVDSLSLYEITDNELDILATGSPSSLQLNFAIFLLSIALSFLISLLTTKIELDRTFNVFVVIVVVTFVVGFIMMFMWWRAHKSTRGIIQEIRDRLPAEEAASPAGKAGPRKRATSKGREQKQTLKVPMPDETEAETGKGQTTGETQKEKGSAGSEVESG